MRGAIRRIAPDNLVDLAQLEGVIVKFICLSNYLDGAILLDGQSSLHLLGLPSLN